MPTLEELSLLEIQEQLRYIRDGQSKLSPEQRERLVAKALLLVIPGIEPRR